MRIPSLLALLVLAGCPQSDGAKKDTAGETGGEDTDIVYETGCITVDGGGGYARIADAVTVAPEGGVIELCAGSYEEAVTVDKRVTIRGVNATEVFLNGPGSDVPITITGAGVTVENLVVTSPRTGLLLDGATDVTLNAITIAAAGSWGITATDTTGAIDGLVLVSPAAGGIQVSGGELALSNADLQYPASFGLDISDDAVVSLTGSTITGTLALSDDVSDGYAVQVDGASFTMADSAIAGADGMGIYGVDAALTVTNSTIADAFYLGVFAFDSTYDFDTVAVTGSYLQGMYLDGPDVSLADTTVSTVTGTSCSLLYAEWGVDGNPWCGGVNIAGDSVTLTNIAVSGYENYGLIVQPNDEDVALLTIDGGTIDDNGRWGAYFVYAEGSVSNFAVTNNREPEILAPCDGYIDQSAALLALYSTLDFDAVTLQGNDGFGLSTLLGTATVNGSTFDGNTCLGLVNYQNQATITGSTFTNGSDRGSVYDSAGVLILDGNTFVNNKAGAAYEYDYGTYIGRSEYSSGQGQDLTAYLSGAIYVTNNTFQSGDSSLTIQSVPTVEITGNSWTDYESSLAYLYQAGDPAIFTDNSADDVVGPVVQTSSGVAEISNVTIGTTRLSDLVEYSYYEDDVLIYNYSYQSSNSVFYASGYYYDDGAGTITDYPGGLIVEDVTVGTAYSTLFYAYDAEVEITNVEVGDVGGYAIGGSWYSYAPDVEVDGLSVGTTASTAFYFYNTFTDAGSVALANVALEGSSSGGIDLTAIGDVTLEDVSLGALSGTGIRSSSRTYDYGYTYDPETGTYTYSYTDIDAATDLSASNVTMASTSSSAVDLTGGRARLVDSSLSAAGGVGVSLTGLSMVDLDAVTIDAAGSYGLSVTDTYSAYSYSTLETVAIDADTVTTLSNVDVTDSGYTGISLSGGSAAITGTNVLGAGWTGLILSGVSADIQGNSFSDNDGFGMECASTTLVACSGNTVTGNVAGVHSGCDDACASDAP